MSGQVKPLHYITVDFRLRSEAKDGEELEASGRHRFLYGVESWIEGIVQHLDGLAEGETLELLLEPEAARSVESQLLGQTRVAGEARQVILELTVARVVEAEPREVVKALARSVHCCDHCHEH